MSRLRESRDPSSAVASCTNQDNHAERNDDSRCDMDDLKAERHDSEDIQNGSIGGCGKMKQET